MNIYAFLDYANFNWDKFDFREIIDGVTRWAKNTNSQNINYTVRIYGGWYFDQQITDQRIEALNIVSSWPTIKRVDNVVVRLKYEFADRIINSDIDDVYDVRRTYIARKSKPRGIKQCGSCIDDSCEIQKIKKWFRNGHACTKPGCISSFSEIFTKYEQKQVDTHLLTDLILTAVKLKANEKICVLSNDIDFLPGIQGVLSLGYGSSVSLVQNERSSWHIENLLVSAGVEMLKVSEVENEST